MYKSVVVLCLVYCVVIEARPKWQFLPPVPGYVPVYIQAGDTPLEQINPELAEAFHSIPAGRSANKHLEAALDIPEVDDEAQPVETPDAVNQKALEKRLLEKKTKKVVPEELPKSVSR